MRLLWLSLPLLLFDVSKTLIHVKRGGGNSEVWRIPHHLYRSKNCKFGKKRHKTFMIICQSFKIFSFIYNEQNMHTSYFNTHRKLKHKQYRHSFYRHFPKKRTLNIYPMGSECHILRTIMRLVYLQYLPQLW